METDLCLLDLPLLVYSEGASISPADIMSPLTKNSVLPIDVLSMLQHASTLHEISQYYVLSDKQDQLDLIVCDSLGDFPWTQSYHSCSLLEDYDDKLIVDFLRYGWPMSKSILPLTNSLAKVNHKGVLEFPDAINHYLATEHSNNTLLGPFFTNPFPDRTASFLLNSVPKRDSDERRVILDMSFPSGHSVNDGIDKDCYLGVCIDLTYPTIDTFVTVVKAVGPGALMYKRDLCRGYHQIWTDPFDVPHQGFFWQDAFYFDTVLVMACTSSIYIC